ncbi:hypothetical protein NQ317_007133 [Molorchus minor]|uniref:Uncharacterized protein n=1 Tax=Molorchus minor TaxID=1323400 RepID=A0ABQ9JXL7_9CUCU|nr:hypothetical protein NQ317_007133 [Molorchus minor]
MKLWFYSKFYLKDYIKAVQVLIDQKAFKRAIYLIDLHAFDKHERSTMSSRNRRKEEKKKINPREGGVYVLALIRLLHILYTGKFFPLS